MVMECMTMRAHVAIGFKPVKAVVDHGNHGGYIWWCITFPSNAACTAVHAANMNFS
jgi:hypothetical protein